MTAPGAVSATDPRIARRIGVCAFAFLNCQERARPILAGCAAALFVSRNLETGCLRLCDQAL